MSTHAKKSATPDSNATPSTGTTEPSTVAASSTTATAASSSITYVTPPPKDANIPVPPSGAAQPPAGNASLTPRASELVALPAAVENLQRFASFVQVFGVSGLPYAQVLQAFTVGSQWSTMRRATAIWDAYSRTQEILAWAIIRSIMQRLGPLWVIATAADPTLAVTYPALDSFLGAKKAIAQKAVTTKRLNKEAIARGEEPTHGAVGKRRKKASEKALAAAAKAAGLTASSTSTPSAPPAASTPSPAPVVSTSTPSGTATPTTHS